MTFWSEEECRNFELGNFFDCCVRDGVLSGECNESHNYCCVLGVVTSI